MFKAFLILVFLAIPLSLFLLNHFFGGVEYSGFFTLIVLLIMLERLWETFFSQKEEKNLSYKGDWTLILTLLVYLLCGTTMVYEFFLIDRDRKVLFFLFGLILYLVAGMIRLWSIHHLGKQWSIHAIGEQRLTKSDQVLVQTGPYMYMRHPIYFGTIVELVGMAIMFNTFYSLILIFFLCPLYFLRATHEEKVLLQIFGEKYLEYKRKTPFILPIRFKNGAAK